MIGHLKWTNGRSDGHELIRTRSRWTFDAQPRSASAARNMKTKPPDGYELVENGSQLTACQERAREILRHRRRRYDLFGRSMFGEPAWEMLLRLYMLDSGQRQTLSRLAEFCGAPKTTAIRWIEYLEVQRLIRRESHPNDKRAEFVELTDRAREALELYLSETLSNGE